MTDNVEANPGSGGPVFASDDLSGVQHPYAKIEFGADGTATPVSSDNPLPVSNDAAEWLLSQIVSLLTSPAGFDRSQARARVTAILESGTVTTVTTVSTVTDITRLNNFGGLPAEAVARHQNLAAWQLCQRSTIS